MSLRSVHKGRSRSGCDQQGTASYVCVVRALCTVHVGGGFTRYWRKSVYASCSRPLVWSSCPGHCPPLPFLLSVARELVIPPPVTCPLAPSLPPSRPCRSGGDPHGVRSPSKFTSGHLRSGLSQTPSFQRKKQADWSTRGCKREKRATGRRRWEWWRREHKRRDLSCSSREVGERPVPTACARCFRHDG